MPFDPRTASLEELAKWTGEAQPGSINHTAGMAELTLRQIKGQIEATEVEKRAAAATERSARYMLWSVVVATLAAIASASSAYFAWKATHQPVPISLTLAPTVSSSQPQSKP